MWEELYQRISQKAPLGPSIQSVIENAFPQAESMLAFRFPESFRQYALTFGPGRLAEYFEVAVPGDPEWGSMDEIIEMNKASNKHAPRSYLEEIHHSDFDRIRRMIYFAETIEGDTIGWDPEEVTEKPAVEYRIYFVPRIGPPTPLVDSFTAFVTEICLGSKLPTILPFNKSQWGIELRQVFTPFF
jgi:hypothetical protein